MKTTIRIIGFAALVALVLSGCYPIIDGGVGAVGIEMPDPNQTGNEADVSAGRIYLLNENALVDVSETDTPELFKSVDIELEENEVTIGPIPSGPGYQVIIALGNIDEITEVFIPTRYAVSASFAVVAGQATPVDLESVSSPFQYAAPLLGENLVDVRFVGAAVYTASANDGSSTAYELNPGTLAIQDEDDLPTGETATSIGNGAFITDPGQVLVSNVPWINTNQGIIPYYSGVLQVDWDSDLSAPLPPVLDSGAFIAGTNDLFGWFQVDGGLGGIYDELVVTGLTKQWLEDIDLSTFIVGQPVLDLAVDLRGGVEVEGYFASKLGAFKLPEEVLTDPAIKKVEQILDAAQFFQVDVDGEVAQITQLSLVIGTNTLYLGTNEGVVRIDKTTVDQDNIPVLDTVTETLGKVVRDMHIGSNYHAILTDNFLITYADGDDTYSVIPIYASIVTEPTGLVLNDLTGLVYISGETGMAWVNINDI